MSDPARMRATAVLALALVAGLLTLEATSGQAFYNGWWVTGLGALLLVGCRGRTRWAVFGASVLGVATAFSVLDLVPSTGLALGWSLILLLPALVAAVLVDDGDGTVRAETQPEQRRFELVWLACGLGAGAAVLVLRLLVEPVGEAGAHAIATFLLVSSSLAVALPLRLARDPLPPLGSRLEHVVALSGTVVLVALLLLVPGSTVVAFLLLANLGWVAVQLRRDHAVRVLAVVALVVFAGTVSGLGPLGDDLVVGSAGQRSALLFGFLLACASVVVPVSVLVMRLKDATAQTRRSQASMDQLLRSTMSTVILATDPAGRLVRLNDGGAGLLGYTEDEIRGCQPSMLHQPGEVDRQAALLNCPPEYGPVIAAQVASGRGYDWEFRTKDDRLVVLRMTIHRLVDDGTGEVTGYFCIGDDVTERLRTQEALRSALQRERTSVAHLIEADRVKQELVSNVSHELRTPITSIAGYAEMLGEGVLGELGQHQANAVDRIARNSARLLDLVEDLLTLSRAESGTLQLDLAAVDLGEVVEEAVEMVTGQLRSRRLEVRFDRPPDPCPVWGDARALERVAVNLLTNAVKFTPDGGAVTVEVERHPDGALLRVRDTGVGISEEDQRRLFDRFFRASTASSEAVPGTGLGLSIVEAITRAHGGTVEVRSRLQAGTTFEITLPRAVPASQHRVEPVGAA